ncbi:sensor histidine kinase [Amycolatopsis sp. NPDC059657]|uniref:sensor histidine kinase n=1 Tax=Amycolatopsis sp. NPDC059657 TaxID=3346899 RepID=UPI0036717B5D
MIQRTGRALLYSLQSIVVGSVCMFAVPALMLAGVLTLFTAGALVMPQVLWLLGKLTDYERHRAGKLLDLVIPGHGPRAKRLGPLLAEPGTRRDLRWVPVEMFVGTILGIVGLTCVLLPFAALATTFFWWAYPADQPASMLVDVPIRSWGTALATGVPTIAIGLLAAWRGAPGLARVSARLSTRLLAPSDKDQLVETLRESRAGAVDAHGAELRRIERDLHDGTQARLVSLAMKVAMAEREKDPAKVSELLASAREGAEDAMTELRGVLRTMYPPILADRGLDGALAAVAARCPVPVELTVGELGNVAAPVESAVYFVITEALTNVAKHSGATGAHVTVTRDVDVLLAEVVDDGSGGVDEERGTGVGGMRRRLAALDGLLKVDSPAGGPTRISLEVPCGS